MTCIRQRKDGGFSECSSPDELVGKGRCCHLANSEIKMELQKIQRGMYQVTINDSPMTIQAQKDTIIKFFNDLPKIDNQTQEKIINYLLNE